MKNIALMIFSNSMGGAESVVEQILINIDKSKYKVHLITNEEIFKNFNIDGTAKHSIGRLFYKGFIYKLINKTVGSERLYKFILRLKLNSLNKILSNNNIQVLHTHLVYDHYLSGLLSNNDIMRIMTIHGSHGLDYKIKSKYNFKPKSIVNIYSKANRITSACEYFINLLKNEGLTDVEYFIVENGINKSLIEEKKVKEEFEGKLRITYLGGNRIVKGWDLLVKAANNMVSQYNKTNFIIDVLREVPEDSEFYKSVRRHGLNDYFVFNGYVGNNNHLKFISKNDLYILPSRTEGIANTLMEAIGMSKPILATDVGGTSEVVNHKMNGYLCETTVESLTEGLLFFYDNPEKMLEFTKANESIKEKFYWETILPKYEAVYK